MTITLDLSTVDELSRMKILKSSRDSGWIADHESRPKVHPDRKMSRFYYTFAVPDVTDRRRANHVSVCLAKQ